MCAIKSLLESLILNSEVLLGDSKKSNNSSIFCQMATLLTLANGEHYFEQKSLVYDNIIGPNQIPGDSIINYRFSLLPILVSIESCATMLSSVGTFNFRRIT